MVGLALIGMVTSVLGELEERAYYLHILAVDENGRPVPVSPLIADTDEDAKRQRDADVRREARIHIKQRLITED